MIFISINDVEQGNLRKICDEVFGAINFEGHIHWRRRTNQPNDKNKMIGIVAEHIIGFSKNKEEFKKSGVGKIGLTGSFSNPDNDPLGDWASKPWKTGSDQSGSRYTIVSPTGIIFNEEWMGEESTFNRFLEEGRIYFPNSGNGSPRKKYYKFERELEGQCANNWWDSASFGNNQEANDILTNLMDNIKNTFSNPKPPRLIKNLLDISGIKDNEIFMDFFLGSGSSFQASLEYDRNIKFIGVQISEELEESNKDHKPAIEFCLKNNLPKTIAEISKERIRRAGAKIKSDNAEKDGINELDTGFRVLKIDTTNMNDIYYRPQDYNQDLLEQLENNIKPDRSDEDLLFQFMLDTGVPLSLPIERTELSSKSGEHTIYRVGGNSLIASLDYIDANMVNDIAALNPLKFITSERAIATDSDKTNIKERFKQLSPHTDVRFI